MKLNKTNASNHLVRSKSKIREGSWNATMQKDYEGEDLWPLTFIQLTSVHPGL